MADQNSQDIRAASRDYKRDSDKGHKWENGVAWGPGRPEGSHPRPQKPRRTVDPVSRLVADSKTVRTRSMRADYAEATDSSADEEVISPNEAPAPDADITYSYDAEKGPSNGSKILGYALEKAVERFESKVTDKLVKDEYLVLDEEGEPLTAKKSSKTATEQTSEPDPDEEYEFV